MDLLSSMYSKPIGVSELWSSSLLLRIQKDLNTFFLKSLMRVNDTE